MGSKPDACRRSWPCDILGLSEVGLAAIKVRLSSHIAKETNLNYADFAECAWEDSHDSRLKENLGGLELPTASVTGWAPQRLAYKPFF